MTGSIDIPARVPAMTAPRIFAVGGPSFVEGATIAVAGSTLAAYAVNPSAVGLWIRETGS